MVKKGTTFKGAPKPFGASGHFNESRRHSLQAKGIKTGNLAGFRPYAFLTRDSNRIEVQARNEVEGFRKAQKEAERFGAKLTTAYTTYGKSGIDTGWRTSPSLKKFDKDGDSIPNKFDCDPKDPTKQDSRKIITYAVDSEGIVYSRVGSEIAFHIMESGMEKDSVYNLSPIWKDLKWTKKNLQDNQEQT